MGDVKSVKEGSVIKEKKAIDFDADAVAKINKLSYLQLSPEAKEALFKSDSIGQLGLGDDNDMLAYLSISMPDLTDAAAAKLTAAQIKKLDHANFGKDTYVFKPEAGKTWIDQAEKHWIGLHACNKLRAVETKLGADAKVAYDEICKPILTKKDQILPATGGKPAEKEGLPPAAIAGIVIAVLLVIGAVIAFVVMRKRKAAAADEEGKAAGTSTSAVQDKKDASSRRRLSAASGETPVKKEEKSNPYGDE